MVERASFGTGIASERGDRSQARVDSSGVEQPLDLFWLEIRVV